MSDNADLITRLRAGRTHITNVLLDLVADRLDELDSASEWLPAVNAALGEHRKRRAFVDDAVALVVNDLAARDAACGHLPNQLVTKILAWAQADITDPFPEFTDGEISAFEAATFEVTE